MANVLTHQMVQQQIASAQTGIANAEAQIAAAQRNIDELKAEIEDLLAAARVISRLVGSTNGIAPDQSIEDNSGVNDFNPFEMSGNPYRASTNKAFMWEVLAKAERIWLTANEIQDRAARIRGSDIPMSSVSPGLSEMKTDGTIERDGMKVALKSRLNENGAPEGAPDAEGVPAPSTNPFAMPNFLGK